MDPLTQSYTPRESLRNRLALGIGVPLAIAFLVVMAIQYKLVRDLVTESLRQRIRAETQIACLRVESDLLGIEHSVGLQTELLRAGARNFVPLGEGESRTKLNTLLSSVLAANSFAFGSAVAFAPGQPGVAPGGFAPYVCRTAAGPLREVDLATVTGYDYWRQPWFVDAASADGEWSEPYFDNGGGNVAMTTFSLRFAATRDLPSGVATADVRLDEIVRGVTRTSLGAPFEVSVISEAGRFIASSIEGSQMKVAADLTRDDERRAILAASAEFLRTGTSFATVGEPNWLGLGATRVVLVRVPTTNWVFAGSFDDDDLMPAILRALALGPGLLLVGAGVALALVWRTTGRAVRPLAGVVEAIGRFSKGDLAARAPVPVHEDEIGTMARAFNAMGDALTGAIAQRERAIEARVAVEAQVSAARGIQRALLPSSDDGDDSGDVRTTDAFAGLSIAATSFPAAEIAGDFFDWFRRDDGRVIVVVADVCGKGMPAAMLMAVGRTLFRRAATELEDPAAVLTRVSLDLSTQAPQSSFTTALILAIDAAGGRVQYANAGHPTGIVLRPDGTASEAMPSTGTVLGIALDEKWESREVGFGVGERIVILSDGVTEAGPELVAGAEAVLFGEARVLECLAASSTRGHTRPVETMNDLLSAVRQFSGGYQRDDITVVVIERKPAAAR